jgi:CRISPR-associated protein Cas2
MVIVDIETSGLNPKKNSILEIGAVDFFNPSNRFYQKCRIFEDEEVDSNALEINGYDKKQLYDPSKQDLKNLLLIFIDWLKPINDKTLGGQNVDFDILFLNEAIKRCNIDWIFGW